MFAADSAGMANGDLSAVAWSADGAWLYAGGKYQDAQSANPVRLWDQEGRGKGRDVAVALQRMSPLLADFVAEVGAETGLR